MKIEKISKSKSKEKYRIKLKEKELMLKNNGLKYFILFPCDLIQENFTNIIYNPSLQEKHQIEKFYKNNIDWGKVRNIGKLDYSQNIIGNTRPKKEVV